MKYVFLTLNWVFGGLFLIGGLILLFDTPVAGLCLIVIGLLLVPPVRNFVHSKTNIEIPVKARGISIFLLLMAGFFFIGQAAQKDMKEKEAIEAAQQAAERAERIKKARQKNIDHFAKNRATIIEDIRKSLDSQDFDSAISQSNKYLLSNDNELSALNKQAKAGKEQLQKEARTKDILATLKTASPEHPVLHQNLYKQLVEMYPENERYKEKLALYTQKVKVKEEKERAAREQKKKEREQRIAKFGEPPKASGWDGSYLPVKQYLRRVANDPDSIEIDECTEVYHTKNGWLVGCNYRGRNAFGGMVRQSHWFTIVRDTVTNMEDSSAYSP